MCTLHLLQSSFMHLQFLKCAAPRRMQPWVFQLSLTPRAHAGFVDARSNAQRQRIATCSKPCAGQVLLSAQCTLARGAGWGRCATFTVQTKHACTPTREARHPCAQRGSHCAKAACTGGVCLASMQPAPPSQLACSTSHCRTASMFVFILALAGMTIQGFMM